MTLVTLVSDQLEVVVDPQRGADILSVRHLGTGTELLFSTPWRGRADALCDRTAFGRAVESGTDWLEHYRGGWQTLLPNAGAPREYRGAVFGYHGEASTVAWTNLHQTATRLEVAVDLFSIPLSVRRHVSVEGGAIHIVDVLTNTSDLHQEFDYVSHPAFGSEFLAGGTCVIDTSAGSFTPDQSGVADPARTRRPNRLPWPSGPGVDNDLRVIPPEGAHQAVFGTLAEFEEAWVSITNPRLGIRAQLSWDASILPYAWFWQELNQSAEFPWFRKARVMAIEPASRPTSGPPKRIALDPGASLAVPVTLTVSRTQDREQAVRRQSTQVELS